MMHHTSPRQEGKDGAARCNYFSPHETEVTTQRRPSLGTTNSHQEKASAKEKRRFWSTNGFIENRRLLKERLVTVYHVKLISAFLFLYACILLWTARSEELDVTGRIARNNEAFFLHHWAKFISAHPVRARDRTGFAEMGLRTQMYSHLLADPTLPNFDYFEEVLWPFIPGIKHLRESYLNGTRTGPKGATRGIVMSMGKSQFIFGVQFIATVRNVHGCNYPIELYYYGEDDLPQEMRTYVTTTFRNVRTIDLEKGGLFDKDLTRLDKQGFALKAFALIATNLTEVILADADAVFLSRPQDFFNVEGYKRTGTLFFHDRDHLRQGPDHIIHEFLADQFQTRGPSERLAKSHFWTKKGIFEQESGIVVVDKSRMEIFSALLFAAWQNSGEIRDQTTYRVFWGDKETFWLAFELAQIPYHFVSHYAGAIGSEEATHGKGFCSEHPLHFFDKEEDESALGKPAWFNGGFLDVKKQSKDRYINATAWAMKGEWEFLLDTEIWCIRNYTRGDMADFSMGDNVRGLVKEALEAGTNALQYIETSTKLSA
ncbi:hypothetical protein CBS101457_006928 [Exobasidium rhododendri]|nr:hypothetical protein CBS101457_006928 [Exobasidium rhododendri]